MHEGQRAGSVNKSTQPSDLSLIPGTHIEKLDGVICIYNYKILMTRWEVEKRESLRRSVGYPRVCNERNRETLLQKQGSRRELNHNICPLTSTCALWNVYTSIVRTHAHIHIYHIHMIICKNGIQKDKTGWFCLYVCKVRLTETESRMMVGGGWGRRRWSYYWSFSLGWWSECGS